MYQPKLEQATAIVQGQTYKFDVYRKGWNLPFTQGVYLFTHKETEGDYTKYNVLYVGKTGTSFSSRITPYHHKWNCASLRGFDHILLYTVYGDSTQSRIERLLIDEWDPPCNEV